MYVGLYSPLDTTEYHHIHVHIPTYGGLCPNVFVFQFGMYTDSSITKSEPSAFSGGFALLRNKLQHDSFIGVNFRPQVPAPSYVQC